MSMNNTQTPSQGRIVLFYHRAAAGLALNLSPLPAIITRVWSDDCINVVVFADGYGPSQCEGVTSVQYADTDEERNRLATSWCWPPRT